MPNLTTFLALLAALAVAVGVFTGMDPRSLQAFGLLSISLAVIGQTWPPAR